MDGLFVALLVVFAISALFLAGFVCTAALIAIIKGPSAAREFIRSEW